MNGYGSVETLERVGGEQAQNLRLVTLCGSIKPLFSGTDDFHENLVEVLRRKQVDALPVDLRRWGLAQVPQLLRHVAAERPDAILMQYPTDAFGAALGPHAFSALQRRAPLVVTLHEFAAANPIRRSSVGVLLARCAAVIATAETERRSLVKWFPWLKARSCVIPVGAPFSGREWQPSEPPIVVHFGQIRPEKGLEEFIACKDVLATQFPGVKFVVVGSRVPKFASYYQAIEIEARNRGIDFLSEMAPDRVPDFLRTATVALLPYPSGASFRRTSLLAAVACGVPIVTLRGAETPPEIMGFLDPVNSIDELVAQTAACLSDKGKRDTAHDKSRQLAALVSWDRIGDRYIEVLRGLTKRRLP